jgi:sterol desaturase/sphingolipid hydroxylase (fatty acid hydroxylase superfamily)
LSSAAEKVPDTGDDSGRRGDERDGMRPVTDLAPPSSWPPPRPATAQPRPRRARRVVLATTVLAAAAAIGLAVDHSPIAAVVAVFVLVVPFEKLFPRHRQPLRRAAAGTDLAYALAAPVLKLTGLVVAVPLAVVSLTWLPGLALRPLVALLPPLPRGVLGVLVFDFVLYWTHRFTHEVPFLWRFHSIHHSTRRLDWISGFRTHPFDGAFLAPVVVLFAAAGFSLRFTGVLTVVQLVTGLFLHANVRWRWRPLQKIVNTSELHHWHHAEEPDAVNTNYAALFPVWDLAFGTFYAPLDRRPQVYGAFEVVPDGIVPQLWFPLRGLRNPLRMLRHPWRCAREVAAMVRRGVGQMARSVTRPRHGFVSSS